MSNTRLVDRVAKDYNLMDGTNIARVIREAALEEQFTNDSIKKHQLEADKIVNKKDTNIILTAEDLEKYKESMNREIITSEETREHRDAVTRPIILEAEKQKKDMQHENDTHSQIDDDELAR